MIPKNPVWYTSSGNIQSKAIQALVQTLVNFSLFIKYTYLVNDVAQEGKLFARGPVCIEITCIAGYVEIVTPAIQQTKTCNIA